jgi:hypothetical protein
MFIAQELGQVAEPGFDWKSGTVDPHQKPTPETVAQLSSILSRDELTSLDGRRARLLAPGMELAWASPQLVVRYERRLRPDHDDFADDAIVLECAGRARRLMSSTIIDAKDLKPTSTDLRKLATAVLHWSADDHLLLVVWTPTWSSEGDSGREVHAELVDVDKTCAR